MARVWSCGFELQSATSGMEWETTVGTVSISTTTVRSGAAALRCHPSGGTGYIQHSILSADDAAAHYYQRVYLNIGTLPSARTTILSWSDGSGWIGCDLDNAGKLLINGAPTTSTPTLTTGTWYRIELDFDDAANVVTVYLDGVQVLQETAYDLGGGAKVRLGVHDTCTANLFFDDYAVNSTSGSVQNGLPGAGKIVHLWPDSAGDNNGFATAVGGTAGAANNYTRVDEFPPDDGTSYNNSSVSGTTTIDDFNVTDSSTAGIGASDSITLVQVGQRAASSTTTTASIVTRLKGQAAGTTTESASIPVNTVAYNTHRSTAPKIHQITALTNPQTSTAWTTTSLDTMQIGYRGNVSQTTQRRITTLWALVEYVPVVATNAPATEATGAGAAADASVALAALAAEATGTGAAHDPNVAVSATAAVAAGTGTAYDATVSTATATSPNAAEATGAGSAFAASVTATANALEATAAGAAQTPQPAVAANAVEATGTGAAADAAAAVAANAAVATAAGAAYDATVSTSSQVTAPAAEATGTGAAFDALPATGASASTASGTGAAQDATVSAAAPASAATGSGTAYDATVSTVSQVDAPAAEATGTGTALDAMSALAALPATATGTGQAFDATVSTTAQTNAPAAEATGTGTAHPATITLTTLAGVAAATGAAYDATVILGAPGTAYPDTATGTGQAFDARVLKRTPRPYAGVTARPGSDATTTRPYAGTTQCP